MPPPTLGAPCGFCRREDRCDGTCSAAGPDNAGQRVGNTVSRNVAMRRHVRAAVLQPTWAARAQCVRQRNHPVDAPAGGPPPMNSARCAHARRAAAWHGACDGTCNAVLRRMRRLTAPNYGQACSNACNSAPSVRGLCSAAPPPRNQGQACSNAATAHLQCNGSAARRRRREPGSDVRNACNSAPTVQRAMQRNRGAGNLGRRAPSVRQAGRSNARELRAACRR